MAATKTSRKPTKKTAKKSPRKSTKSSAKRTPATARSTAKRTTKSAQKTARKTGRKATSSARKATRKTARKATTTARKATRKATSAARKTTRKATTTARKATRKTTRATNRGPSNRSNGQRLDAIALLKQDHREVEEMFSRFERAGSGAGRRKEQLRDSIVEALSRHAAIEELVFYPAVREEVRGAGSTVLESLEEHHIVKVTLRECEDMAPSDERFTAKMTVMMESVRHHVKEEERELFPKVRRSMSRARLLELGDALQTAKRSAPTRPHPYAPDQPPGLALVGGATAVVDRARTTGKRAIRRVREELPV